MTRHEPELPATGEHLQRVLKRPDGYEGGPRAGHLVFPSFKRYDTRRGPVDVDLCPFCGEEIEDQWADDGESDLADWQRCDCGYEGALVDTTQTALTLNGVDTTPHLDRKGD